MSNNRGILILIAVVVVAIFGLLAIQKDGIFDRRTGLEKAADGIGEAVEEVGDEIDDATTRRD
jgi:hypothetical protein